MLHEKDRNYFEGLIIKKISETKNRNIAIESIKVDEFEKKPDILDQASMNQNRDIALFLLEKNNLKIDGFKDALERIHEGTYGICEGCSEKISKRRLKVIPFARYCINCQRENEIRPREAPC